MAFPFDILDLVLPEIAHWVAGKSSSEKRRFHQAGLGLLLLGILFAVGAFVFGGFKYELQHGLTRRETPRGVS
jgi:hypothetical protein